jgi:hypothetical protein
VHIVDCGALVLGLMSALGQKQTFSDINAMSALPPKADISQRRLDVRFVPKADERHCSNLAVIRSPRPHEQVRSAAPYSQLERR